MKRSANILLNLVCFFLFAACSATDSQQVLLNRADSLMPTHPDSALAFLESLSQQDVSSPAAQARYNVLITQAYDKNYIRHTEDSTIRSAVKFFDSVGNVPMQAKAHFYLARVLQDKKEKTEAVKEYWEAVPLAEKAGDTELLSMAVGNLGYLYLGEKLYDKADSLYFRAECLAVVRKDSTRLASILSVRGRIYAEKGVLAVEKREEYFLKAKYYLDQAIRIAAKIRKCKIENSALMHLAALYNLMGNTTQVIECAKRSMLFCEDSLSYGGYYLMLGNVYYKAERYDSAAYYWTQSLKINNYYTKADAAMKLSDIAKLQNNMSMALHWEKLHAIYKDSIILSESSIDMLTAEHKHQLRQNEQQYKSGINYYNYLIGCVVLVLLVWVLIWRRKRKNFQKRMRALQTEKDRIEKEKLEQLRDIENQLHAKKQEVKVAYGAVQEDRKKTAVLHAELEKLCTHRQEMFMSYMRESKEYKYLMDFIRKVQEQDMPLTFEENQWRSLVKVIDKFSIGFTEHLLAKYPALNPEDVRFCCLLKLELPYPDIAAVCARTPSAIYKRRTNILEKMKPAEEDASLRSIVRKI